MELVGKQTDEEKEARKAEIEEARQRAIKNLKSALSYLEMPESQMDIDMKAWGALIGIAAATYAVARMRVKIEVQDEQSQDKTLDVPLGRPFLN